MRMELIAEWCVVGKSLTLAAAGGVIKKIIIFKTADKFLFLHVVI